MTSNGIRGRLRRVAGVALAVVFCSTVPALAQPSLDQYVERVPTAEGDRPSAPPGKDSEPLAPAAARALEGSGGESAADLRAVAESPQLGAPRTRRGGGAAPTRVAVPAAASAAQDGGAPIGWLVAGMALSGLAAVAFSLTRRQRKRRG